MSRADLHHVNGLTSDGTPATGVSPSRLGAEHDVLDPREIVVRHSGTVRIQILEHAALLVHHSYDDSAGSVLDERVVQKYCREQLLILDRPQFSIGEDQGAKFPSACAFVSNDHQVAFGDEHSALAQSGARIRRERTQYPSCAGEFGDDLVPLQHTVQGSNRAGNKIHRDPEGKHRQHSCDEKLRERSS